ncbi:Leucine-rich repeat-containing protein 49 [Microtus ochrogaster]|uniref:Leucine-rich repeat-containing protein 49 n=1 Tax=Microtus ochrogaster TaxID=79684 RepID=A0A8J6GND0_MICOH|nr:Leucine-rich repeat-containing protein 49 [Microtus ochrogaster]
MVTTISFTFIEFDEIVQVLPKLKMKFPNSLHLKFKETNLVMLQQFNALAQLRRVDQLTIDPQGNPVVNFTLWKYYVLFRLSHFGMQKINGTEYCFPTRTPQLPLARPAKTQHIVGSVEICRKKQFRYLIESKGKKPGIISEETSDSKRPMGENKNCATLNYTTREFYHEKLELGIAGEHSECGVCKHRSSGPCSYCSNKGKGELSDWSREKEPGSTMLDSLSAAKLQIYYLTFGASSRKIERLGSGIIFNHTVIATGY